MSTKITVNGVAYDSVEAMPAEVRKTYEETMATLSQLGDVKPTVIEGQFGPVHLTTTVRKRIVVNGGAYDDEESMPPDVRQSYEAAKPVPGDPNTKTNEIKISKNEIKISFQVTGPHATFRKTFDSAQPTSAPSAQPSGMPSPIEPASVNRGLLLAVGMAAGAAIALALWLIGRSH